MRNTLASFKTTANWPQVLNMDSSDPRWLNLLNEASFRLLSMGMWVGTTFKYAICVNNACITWPRNFESIIAMDVCDSPMTLRSQWHEFLENGPGLARLKCCNSMNSFDRGAGFTMFDDLYGNSIIRLYPQFASDVSKTVTIRGLDSNYQRVLTVNGTVDGEVIPLALPFVDSNTVWGRQVIREVIKQPTIGYVRAYAYDAALPPPPASPGPNDTPLIPLAIWEPTETLPDYRRSFIPALDSIRGCRCSDTLTSDCQKTRVTVIAKQKFIPVASDLDFLPIGNAPALKLAMLAVMREERGDTAGAQTAMYGVLDPVRRRYVNGAVPILDDELSEYQGAGVVIPIRLESSLTDRATLVNII